MITTVSKPTKGIIQFFKIVYGIKEKCGNNKNEEQNGPKIK